ncbi:MAG: hypothetical protein M1812_007436 [Candelaria pacifica]|nr:MAG: hypothetical protein M1812_007436 [Candelaria pacifica]
MARGKGVEEFWRNGGVKVVKVRDINTPKGIAKQVARVERIKAENAAKAAKDTKDREEFARVSGSGSGFVSGPGPASGPAPASGPTSASAPPPPPASAASLIPPPPRRTSAQPPPTPSSLSSLPTLPTPPNAGPTDDRLSRIMRQVNGSNNVGPTGRIRTLTQVIVSLPFLPSVELNTLNRILLITTVHLLRK